MIRKATMPIEAARQLAKSITDDVFMEGFYRGLAEAEAANWDAVTILVEGDEEGGYDVKMTEPTGVIVGWFLPAWEAQQLAIPGGEPAEDLHITLAYLGEASAMSADQQRTLIGVTSEVALRHQGLVGELTGVGRFTNGQETDPFWAGVDIPGLRALREDLVAALAAAGIPLQGFGADKDYHPHVTVAYIPADEPSPAVTIRSLPVTVNELTVAIGGARHRVALQPHIEDEYVYDAPSAYIPQLVTKSKATIEEDRFTLAPWYVPNSVDAHGDWTDPAEIQKALWSYVDSGDREIKLQHNREIRAGRWVEAMTWPFEVEVPLTKADGTVTKYKYPAGTPFMGVVWDEWAWDLVKAGELRGFSIGGTGDLVVADLPEPADA